MTFHPTKPGFKENSWMDQADCLSSDPSIFFDQDASDEGRARAKKAKAICDECPAQDECLEYALSNNIEHGMWGGKSERQRRRIRRARRRK